MILYILTVTIIAGAIVADHYQAHGKKKFDEIKKYVVDGYKFHTRDKLAGLRAMDEEFNDSIEYLSKVKGKYTFDKALDKAVDNIHKGKMKDSMDRMRASIDKDVAQVRADAQKIRDDARRAGIEPAAFSIKQLRKMYADTTTRTTTLKRSIIKRKTK